MSERGGSTGRKGSGKSREERIAVSIISEGKNHVKLSGGKHLRIKDTLTWTCLI